MLTSRTQQLTGGAPSHQPAPADARAGRPVVAIARCEELGGGGSSGNELQTPAELPRAPIKRPRNSMRLLRAITDFQAILPAPLLQAATGHSAQAAR